MASRRCRGNGAGSIAIGHQLPRPFEEGETRMIATVAAVSGCGADGGDIPANFVRTFLNTVKPVFETSTILRSLRCTSVGKVCKICNQMKVNYSQSRNAHRLYKPTVRNKPVRL